MPSLEYKLLLNDLKYGSGSRNIMKLSALHINKGHPYQKMIIQILVFVFIFLMYSQADHYPHCLCIFPDEIMDLHACIMEEQTFHFECTDDMRLPSFMELINDSLKMIEDVFPYFLHEDPVIKFFQKRLFLLQHYKS